MRIIFIGSGEFGLPTLAALMGAGHEIVTVYTQPDRPAGRGRKVTPTAIAEFAQNQSLQCIATENLNAEKLPECDLMVVIAFGQKISPAAAAHARMGSVNLHASQLPKLRGAAPVNWAIINGERVTGNSIIRLAQKMDAGAVLGQSSVEIGPLETAGELHDLLAADGAGLMLRVIGDLQAGGAVETPQDESAATSAETDAESGPDRLVGRRGADFEQNPGVIPMAWMPGEIGGRGGCRGCAGDFGSRPPHRRRRSAMETWGNYDDRSDCRGRWLWWRGIARNSACGEATHAAG